MKQHTKYFFVSICIFLLSINKITAQEIIVEKDTVKKVVVVNNLNKRQKIDGIVANVGDYIVLDSDVDKAFIEISAQGGSTKDITRCQMLGKLLEDKLYAHQAIQDSIVVTDSEIKSTMSDKISSMLEQVGDMKKILKFYNKESEEDFKAYFFEILKEGKLASEMQRKIVDKVEITPEEVRTFFKTIPEGDLPVFGAEVDVAQIVVAPKITDEERQKVIDKLKGFKKEVLAGGSFATKAVLYTEDPGTKSNGGYYKMNRKTPFVKEFKQVAFSLLEGEISEPFETQYGYHIIMVEKIKGQDIELRHILMSPKFSEASIKEAKDKLTLIRTRILEKAITFADAARTTSDEKETRANGGQLINPKTQDTHFELTKMDPELYGKISGLKDAEITLPFLDEDSKGVKRFKIITVTNRGLDHKADYAKDYLRIKEIALKEKQIKAIAKWTEEKIKETFIKINADYKDCAFTNNWIKK